MKFKEGWCIFIGGHVWYYDNYKGKWICDYCKKIMNEEEKRR